MNKVIVGSVLAAFLSVGAASLAIGQTGSNESPASSLSAPAAKSEHHWFSHATSTERMDERLAKTRGKLQITAAEQTQWDAYANFLRRTAQEQQQSKGSHESHDHQSSAIEQLDREQMGYAKAATWLTGLSAVEKPLYATLSPEQKQVADKVFSKTLRKMSRKIASGFGHDHEWFGRG